MRALEERGLRDNLVEPGGMSAAEAGGVGVVREAQNRDVRVVVRDILRVDARDVRDHEIGRLDPIRRLEAMLGQDRFELRPDEEVDPTQQDRCHA